MDVVVEEKHYTGDNAPKDSFRIIGAYTKHSDAYMVAKKQFVSKPFVTGRELIERLVYDVDSVAVGQITTANCQTLINVYRVKGD